MTTLRGPDRPPSQDIELERASEHPIPQAIAAGAAERVGELPPVEDSANVPGLGVQGMVEGHAVLVADDVVEPTSRTAIAELRALGLTPGLLNPMLAGSRGTSHEGVSE